MVTDTRKHECVADAEKRSRIRRCTRVRSKEFGLGHDRHAREARAALASLYAKLCAHASGLKCVRRDLLVLEPGQVRLQGRQDNVRLTNQPARKPHVPSHTQPQPRQEERASQGR